MIRLPPRDDTSAEEEKTMASKLVKQTVAAYVITCGILRACKQPVHSFDSSVLSYIRTCRLTLALWHTFPFSSDPNETCPLRFQKCNIYTIIGKILTEIEWTLRSDRQEILIDCEAGAKLVKRITGRGGGAIN